MKPLAAELDEAWVREHVFPRFSRVLRRDEIYLANHSLGRPPDRMAQDVQGALDLWYEDMDGAWTEWLAEMGRFRANVARLTGFSRPDSIVPKTSAGQGLRAVLNALLGERPLEIVSTTGEFDSVDFILKTYAQKGHAQVRWVEPTSGEGGVPLFEAEEVCKAIDGDVKLVVLSIVFFTTGQILVDVEKVVAKAHEHGALVLLDAYHAAGVIPLELESLGADFAIGGAYKYLRGGPGACWLAIHPRHLDGLLRTLDTGWFAKRDPFGYSRPDEPQLAKGGDVWLESTPPVLMPYQAKAGLELTLEIGVERLRAYSLNRLDLLQQALAAEGAPLFLPRDRKGYGAFALLPHREPVELVEALGRSGVNVDARGAFVRLGPDLLTTADEIAEAARVVASLG
jgi:kynureninase